MKTDASRRAFLQRAAMLSVAGVATPLAVNLAAMAEAAAATATDYKAIVCVFLYGGNDYANTLVPYDASNYNAYFALRPKLAFQRDALSATVLKARTIPFDAAGVARQYALAPGLAPLLPIFDAGKMGVLLNVGNLIQPTTKLQYTKKTARLPAKLFSHNDQQSEWQSSLPEGAPSGWGGRLGDLFESGNGNATFTCVNVSGNAVFLAGREAVQYQVSSSGSVPFTALQQALFGSSSCSAALQTLMTQQHIHPMQADYASITQRAISANTTLTAALKAANTISTPFPTPNSLADQLKMVARMISSATEIGAKRQIYFVSMGGFDTHDGLTTVHPNLMKNVAEAMAAFYQSTVELGVANQVTAFTASDFGRTLSGNNDGSDHGWGSMHFMLGGAVKGGRFYGTPPVVASDGPDDVGQGRLLPTTSIEQYAATLGKWMGASDADLLGLLPNLANYNASARNLGFV